MQTNDLMNRALTAEPFECKDIEIALHEIRQMQKDIEKLQTETNERTNIIQNLIGKFNASGVWRKWFLMIRGKNEKLYI